MNNCCKYLIKNSLVLLLSCGIPGIADAQQANKLPEDVKRLVLQENYEALIPKLKILAEKGHLEAQYQLGLLYLHGNGIEKNHRHALFWFEKAAKEKHAKSLFNAAALMQKRDGFSSTVEQYLMQAAHLGHKMAKRKLEQLTSQASGTLSEGSEATEQLWHSIKKGDQAQVDSLVRQGVDMNRRNHQGKTALLIAIDNKHSELVAYLLSKGANANTPDLLGDAPLHYAVRVHHPKILKILISNAELNLKNNKGVSPLFLAVSLSDFSAVKQLLESGANVNTQNNQHQSAYTLAKLKNNRELIKLLAQYGADSAVNDHKNRIEQKIKSLQKQLDQSQFNGWNELMLASWLGDNELVKWFLAADPINSKQAINAYRLALQAGYAETAILLVESLAGTAINEAELSILLNLAIEHSSFASFKFVFERLGNQTVEARASWAPRLLFNAIALEKVSYAHYLIEQKVQADFIAEDSATCLIKAAENGLTSVVEKLLNSGVAIDLVNAKGRSALWYAAGRGDNLSVQQLISKNANPDLADYQGITPLFRAIHQDRYETVKLLIKSGANIKHKTQNGNNALMTSVAVGNERMVTLFLDNDIDVAERNNSSHTALMIAVKKGELSMARKLIKAGAKSYRKNRLGQSALDMAINEEMKALLKN